MARGPNSSLVKLSFLKWRWLYFHWMKRNKMEMALFPLLEADCPDGRLVLIAVVRCLGLPVVKPGVPVLAGRWGLTVEI